MNINLSQNIVLVFIPCTHILCLRCLGCTFLGFKNTELINDNGLKCLNSSNIQSKNHREKRDTTNTYMKTRSISVIGTGTSIKSDVVKLVLRAKPSFLNNMIGSCKCLSVVSKMLPLTHNWANSFVIKAYEIILKSLSYSNV